MLKKLIFFILLIFFIVYYGFNHIKTIKNLPIRFWDEFYWISRSFFYDYTFIKKDFNKDIWSMDFAKDHPFIAHFFYGLLINLKYKDEIKREGDLTTFLIKNNFYLGSDFIDKYGKKQINHIRWDEDDSRFREKEYLIKKYGDNFKNTIDIILYLRKINLFIFLISTLIFSFIFFYILKNIFFSLILFLSLIFNKYFLEYSVYVHAENLFIFFTYIIIFLYLITFYKLDIFFNKNKKDINYLFFSNNFVLIILLIFLASFTFNIKIIGAVNIVGIALMPIFLIKTLKKITLNYILFFIKFLIIIFIFSIFFIIILNPGLFFGYFNIYDLINYRKLEQYKQVLGNKDAVFENNFSSLDYFNDYFFGVNSDYYNFFFFIPVCGKFLFFLSGILYGFKNKYIRVIILFLFLYLLFHFLFIKLKWDRYYLIYVPFISFFQVFGVMNLVYLLTKKIRFIIFKKFF